MVKKKFVAVALAAALGVGSLGAAAGCGSKKGENELWITYFKGGYGSEWVEQLARKFEAEHEGVTVRTDGDTQLINAVANMMKNGTNYDLIFCHDVTWEDFVGPGYIYNLDGLYSTVVNEATGETFADRVWDEDVLSSARYPDRNGDYHYYKVPWTIGTAGIAYNLTVMDRVDNYLKKTGADHTWNRTAPVDYYELLQYCEDIEAAHLTVDPDEPTSELITPFTWSGVSEEWQWDYVVFDWWGQLAGPETMNTFKNFGNVDENFNLVTSQQKNPDKEVYNPDKFAVVRNDDGTVDKENSTYVGWGEFQQAYQLWYDLIVDHKDWSTSKISNYSKFENENAFASGSAAMTPAACWVEYESKTYLEASGNEISIMATPMISEVKVDKTTGKVLPKDTAVTSNVTVIDAIRADAGVTEKTLDIDGKVYNRVSFTSSFGDSAMIPAKSSGRELAVEFLLFMQEEENAQLFTKLSGGTVLPYKYDYSSSFVDENGVDRASAWQKSIFEIDRNSTKFNNYTQHPMMRKTDLRGSARMTTIWPTNSYYYLKAWQDSAKYNPLTFLKKDIYEDIINKRWETYKKDL